MGAHVRALTTAQARALGVMRPHGVFDAWALSKRITTLYELEALGLVARGRRGWTDAVLTPAGRTLREALLQPVAYAEAAE